MLLYTGNRTSKQLIICLEKYFKFRFEIRYVKCPGNSKISNKITYGQCEGLSLQELESCLIPLPGSWHQCEGKYFQIFCYQTPTKSSFYPLTKYLNCSKDHRESTKAVCPDILTVHSVAQSLTEMQNLRPLTVWNQNLHLIKISSDSYAHSSLRSTDVKGS